MSVQKQLGDKLSPWSWNQKTGFLPHVFRNFTDLPRVWNTNKVQNLTMRLKEVAKTDPPAGLRYVFLTWPYLAAMCSPMSLHQPSSLLVLCESLLT